LSQVPIYYKGRFVGKVVYGSNVELVTFRSEKHIFAHTPCKRHEGFCAGLTVSKQIVDQAYELGARFVKIILKTEIGSQTYVTSILKLRSEAHTMMDDFQELQYALPIHEWIKL
jgi:hypothetical protein